MWISTAGDVQSRFAMVGGLHCLMSAVKELAASGEEREGVCLHLLQCVSATASGHCEIISLPWVIYEIMLVFYLI